MCRDLRNLNIATEFGLNFTIWMNNNQSTFQENDFLMILKRQMKTITKMQLALILISLIIERNLLNKLNAFRTENKKSHDQNSKNIQIFSIFLCTTEIYSAMINQWGEMFQWLGSGCLPQGGDNQEVHHHAAQDVDRPGPDEHEGHLPPGDIVRLYYHSIHSMHSPNSIFYRRSSWFHIIYLLLFCI